jgi:DNA-binding transcriptional LysR family regulator
MAITFRMIEAFRAVMLTGGMTKAAEMLHISQPSVTRLIHDLEQTLDLSLFVPDGRRIKPTNDAVVLLEEVEHSYAGLSRIEAAGRQLTQNKTRTLRVSAMPALGLSILPAAVNQLIEETGANVQIHVVASPVALQLVTEQKFDLALALSYDTDKSLERIDEIRGDCRVILPPGHPWKSRRSISINALDGEAFISYSANVSTGVRLNALMAARKVTPRIVAVSSQSLFISDLVLQGAAIGVVDSLMALRHTKLGGHALRLTPNVEFVVGAFVAAGRARHPLVPALLDALRAVNERRS